MYFVYVLWSNKLSKRYVGSTSDVDRRINEHNTGCNKFTKSGKPWNLLHTGKYSNKTEALKREKFLKSGVGRKWLDNNLIK